MDIAGFELTAPTVWLIIAVLFGIIEVATVGISSIWFVFGAAAAMVLALLGFPVPLQIAVFLIVSVVLLVFTRPILVEKLNLGKAKTNVETIVGKEGLVIKSIDNVSGVGQVKIGGQIWSARSATGEKIEREELVMVEKVEGVKVIVRKIR